MPSVALYAMGGGFGHGARALGLARALVDEGLSCVVLGPSRLAPLAAWAGVPLASPPSEPPSAEALGAWVAGFSCDLRVVDVFPRGVLGELRPVARQVLVTRYVDPRFYAAPAPASALGWYDAVLATEPCDVTGAVRVPPITLRSPVPWNGGRRVVSLLEGTEFPVSYESCRAVVAGAGYGSYYEIVEAGLPAVLVPLPRRVDDQALRASGGLGVPLRAPSRVVGGLDEVPDALASLAGAERVGVVDLGGAREAAARIIRALRGASGSRPGTCRTGDTPDAAVR